MIDYLDLALKYGGFTSLDKCYLKNTLETLSDQQKLRFITPPPSVINAYFAETYQKQGAQAATDYFYQLSKNLDLCNDSPSFDEHLPFIRLNLSGKSFGFTYSNSEEEIALVFPEDSSTQINNKLLLEIALVFPHYTIYTEENQIKLSKINFDETHLTPVEQSDYLLTEISKSNELVKIQGFNQEEALEVAENYKGEIYFNFNQRQTIIYIVLK